MMIQSPSRRLALLKYSLALPLGAFLLLLFAASPADAQQAPPPPPPPPPPAPKSADTNNPDEVYMVVDEMPTFPGCEDKLGQADYQSCAQMAMLQFIYENIRYPEEAKESNIQGTVVVRFIVEKDGSLSDIAVVREIGGGCGEEVQRTIASMPKWNPGKQNGETVRVQFNLPVRFKMDTEEAAPSESRTNTLATSAPELVVQNFQLTPNPGNGLFVLQMTLPSSSSLRMRVFDLQGVLHQTVVKAVEASGFVRSELDISHLPSGTYLLQMEQDGKVKTEKLMLVQD